MNGRTNGHKVRGKENIMDFENKESNSNEDIVEVGLMFLDNRTYTYNGKIYTYYMTKDYYKEVYDILYDKEFSIINEKGYDYRGSTLKMVNSVLIKGPNVDKVKSKYVKIETVIYDFINHRMYSRDNPFDIYDPMIDNYNSKLIDKNNSTLIKEMENNKMNKFGINARFGKVPTNEIRMSIYGPAFSSSDGFFAFDGNDYINVTDFLIGNDNYCYMMPATEEQVNIGDFIYNNNGWCRVIDAKERTITVEKITTHEVVEILPTKNIFGFNFYTKLFIPFNIGSPNKDNPFGNMLPFLIMSDNNNSDLALMMMLMNNQNGFTFDYSNPMAMYMMMSMLDGKTNTSKDSMLAAMFMGRPVIPVKSETHSCTCNCSDGR